MSDVTHIITCLYKFSIAIRDPVPKERLHEIAHIDVSHFEAWDINHVNEKFCPVDPRNNFRVAQYLSERLGKANTRRRQLLKYYEAHHKEISRYIDNPLSTGSSIVTGKSTNTSNLVAPTVQDASVGASAKVPNLEKAASTCTMTKSQTALSTIKVELTHAAEIGQDKDQLSQTSYATSTNHTGIQVPSSPTEEVAFEGKPFECPYCFKIVKVRSRQDWK